MQILEGAPLAAGEPLSVERMALLFEENERPSKDDIRAAIKLVDERCGDRGYELVSPRIAFRCDRIWRPAGWSAGASRPLFASTYGNARLPTVSPSRGEIEEIRGVA